MTVGDHQGDELRIGTVERESAVKCLSDHMAEGRLTVEEYEERVTATLESRTKGELRKQFADLPAPYPWILASAPAPIPPPPPPSLLPPPTGQPVRYPPTALAGQSERYRVVAGVMQIAFPFGIGRFYTGHTGVAVAQLLTAFIGIGVIWSIIDGIIMLAGGGRDAWGRDLRW